MSAENLTKAELCLGLRYALVEFGKALADNQDKRLIMFWQRSVDEHVQQLEAIDRKAA